MKARLKPTQYPVLVGAFILISSASVPGNFQEEWKETGRKQFSIHYTAGDEGELNNYVSMLESGAKTVEGFFNNTFPRKFDVYVHPGRNSLDKQWQKDWKMPEFKSECWMVASGVASKLDLISPLAWEKEACEHTYTDKVKTQQLITHELVHVYHGQMNKSPDFSETTGIDWFVEGLATYASGQLDSSRIAAVKKAIEENTVPSSLDKFWTGKLKYGLSGSLVMYVDQKYGRTILISMLPHNNLNELLAIMNSSEQKLIDDWKEFVMKK